MLRRLQQALRLHQEVHNQRKHLEGKQSAQLRKHAVYTTRVCFVIICYVAQFRFVVLDPRGQPKLEPPWLQFCLSGKIILKTA